MTMEDKRLQRKINVVKKKMKRIKRDNALQPYVDIKEKSELVVENKEPDSIWGWIKNMFC
jgi:hypothetical protein